MYGNAALHNATCLTFASQGYICFSIYTQNESLAFTFDDKKNVIPFNMKHGGGGMDEMQVEGANAPIQDSEQWMNISKVSTGEFKALRDVLINCQSDSQSNSEMNEIISRIDMDHLCLWGHSMGADNVFYAAKEMSENIKAVLMMEPCFNAITDFPEPNGRSFKGFPNDPEWLKTDFPFLLVNSFENLNDKAIA